MPQQCGAPSRLIDSPLFNASELFQQRWEDSPKDDRKRLEKCWGYMDCGECHRSDGFCGWCAISSTCLPLPMDPLSRAFPLLSPMRYKFICAMGPERFELRTSGLGCQVSTITFLTSIVTIFCTIFGLVVLYGLVKLAKWIGIASRAHKGGWVVYEDGSGEIWVRRPDSWGRWWRKVIGRPKEEEEMVLDDGIEERSKWVWRNVFSRRKNLQPEQAERRPLLS
ncbi:hypothetical protein K505DRAFT_345250 [Melanomma pulvis-pyrius CBS 109.77]|uniref:PSI domain-containing protein n=1 Tax=Melanomma pulvis-pyrius CBS 109.77 TaxID=1314802 RepID=A0A6A6XWN6_9PLEO|nr:hypothetical protein K505DRAFT_345250 [Melanomma pulvis-pyrius CBS 109.77]